MAEPEMVASTQVKEEDTHDNLQESFVAENEVVSEQTSAENVENGGVAESAMNESTPEESSSPVKDSESVASEASEDRAWAVPEPTPGASTGLLTSPKKDGPPLPPAFALVGKLPPSPTKKNKPRGPPPPPVNKIPGLRDVDEPPEDIGALVEPGVYAESENALGESEVGVVVSEELKEPESSTDIVDHSAFHEMSTTTPAQVEGPGDDDTAHSNVEAESTLDEVVRIESASAEQMEAEAPEASTVAATDVDFQAAEEQKPSEPTSQEVDSDDEDLVSLDSETQEELPVAAERQEEDAIPVTLEDPVLMPVTDSTTTEVAAATDLVTEMTEEASTNQNVSLAIAELSPSSETVAEGSTVPEVCERSTGVEPNAVISELQPVASSEAEPIAFDENLPKSGSTVGESSEILAQENTELELTEIVPSTEPEPNSPDKGASGEPEPLSAAEEKEASTEPFSISQEVPGEQEAITEATEPQLAYTEQEPSTVEEWEEPEPSSVELAVEQQLDTSMQDPITTAEEEVPVTVEEAKDLEPITGEAVGELPEPELPEPKTEKEHFLIAAEEAKEPEPSTGQETEEPDSTTAEEVEEPEPITPEELAEPLPEPEVQESDSPEQQSPATVEEAKEPEPIAAEELEEPESVAFKETEAGQLEPIIVEEVKEPVETPEPATLTSEALSEAEAQGISNPPVVPPESEQSLAEDVQEHVAMGATSSSDTDKPHKLPIPPIFMGVAEQSSPPKSSEKQAPSPPHKLDIPAVFSSGQSDEDRPADEATDIDIKARHKVAIPAAFGGTNSIDDNQRSIAPEDETDEILTPPQAEGKKKVAMLGTNADGAPANTPDLLAVPFMVEPADANAAASPVNATMPSPSPPEPVSPEVSTPKRFVSAPSDEGNEREVPKASPITMNLSPKRVAIPAVFNQKRADNSFTRESLSPKQPAPVSPLSSSRATVEETRRRDLEKEQEIARQREREIARQKKIQEEEKQKIIEEIARIEAQVAAAKAKAAEEAARVEEEARRKAEDDAKTRAAEEAARVEEETKRHTEEKTHAGTAEALSMSEGEVASQAVVVQAPEDETMRDTMGTNARGGASQENDLKINVKENNQDAAEDLKAPQRTELDAARVLEQLETTPPNSPPATPSPEKKGPDGTDLQAQQDASNLCGCVIL